MGHGVPEGLRRPASYLPEMESWRGWAILLVVLFHYLGILAGGSPLLNGEAPLWLSWIAAGNTGVTLFFVLSGFLLSRPFIDGLRQGEPIDLVGFFSARILRIVPLYYLVVLLAWGVTANSEALKALLFIPIGFGAFPFSVPWWSLCTEAQFYLVLPLVFWLLRQHGGQWLFMVLLVVWLLLQVYFFHLPGWLAPNNGWESSLFGRGAAFLLGGVFAWLSRTPGFAWLSRSRLAINLLFFVALGALLTLLAWYGETGQRQALMRFPLYHHAEAMLWGLLLLASLSPVLLCKRLFINGPARHLGTISYSLYLVHVPVQFYLIYPQVGGAGQRAELLQSGVVWAVCLSALMAWLLALLSYHCIERPFLRLKARLPQREKSMALASQ